MGKPGPDPQVTDDELIEIVKRSDKPVVTAVEVAEETELGRRGISDRLKRLSEQGRLRRDKLGADTVIYWSSDD